MGQGPLATGRPARLRRPRTVAEAVPMESPSRQLSSISRSPGAGGQLPCRHRTLATAARGQRSAAPLFANGYVKRCDAPASPLEQMECLRMCFVNFDDQCMSVPRLGEFGGSLASDSLANLPSSAAARTPRTHFVAGVRLALPTCEVDPTHGRRGRTAGVVRVNPVQTVQASLDTPLRVWYKDEERCTGFEWAFLLGVAWALY
jgi:hypothetical protein